MALSSANYVAFKAAINAETNATLVAHRAAGRTDDIAQWYNGNAASGEFCWMREVSRRDFDEAVNYDAAFAALSDGVRDEWRFFLEACPRDMTKNRNRKAVTDVFGPVTAGSQSEKILNACNRRVTRAEKALATLTAANEGTITAFVLSVEGPVTSADVIAALRS